MAIVSQQMLIEFITETFRCGNDRCFSKNSVICTNRDEQKYAPSVELTFTCKDCRCSSTFSGGPKIHPTGKRSTMQSLAQARVAAASAIATMEFTETSRFLAAMDIPCISESTWHKQRQSHGNTCTLMAQQSREKHGADLADENGIIAHATWDEAWTHRRHAQDCTGTLMAPGRESDSKSKIIATAIVSRNNIDIPQRNSEGNWMIARHGDQGFYGSSNAMAGQVMTDAMNEMKRRNLWIRSLCTDADAKAFGKAKNIQGNFSDGTMMVSTRDFGHKKKNLKTLVEAECEKNGLLVKFAEPIIRNYSQCVRVNTRNKGGKDDLKRLLKNLECHIFYDDHTSCTDGCPRRFRDIILNATSSLFQATADIGTIHKGDIIHLKSDTVKVPSVPFDIITISTHNPASISRKFEIGMYTYTTLFLNDDPSASTDEFYLQNFYRLWDIYKNNEQMDHLFNQHSENILTVESLPKTIDITATLENVVTNADADDINDGDDDDDNMREPDVDDEENDGNVEADYLQLPYEQLGEETSIVNKVSSQPRHLIISADSHHHHVLQPIKILIPPLKQDKLRKPKPGADSREIRAYDDAEARKNKIMHAMLDDSDYYADGAGTTQNESLHHARLIFTGYKYKHFKYIVCRINEADLRWNEGQGYVLEVFRRQNITLSPFATRFFQRLVEEDERCRKLNMTVKRKKYLKSRKMFVRNRALAVQVLDDDGYGVDENGLPKKKRKTTVVPEEEQCTFWMVNKNQKCHARILNLDKSKSAKVANWINESKVLGKFCATHMEEGCKREQIEGWK